MKNEQKKTPQRITTTCFLMGCCLAWVLSTGCSEAPQVAEAPQGAPIQGEPIQGAPIESSIANPEPTADPIETPQEAVVEAQPTTELKEPNAAPREKPMESIALDTTEAKDPGTPSPDEANEPKLAKADIATDELMDQLLLSAEQTDSAGYLSISFDKLASFDYQMPEDLTEPVANEEGEVYKEQIPADIKALNAKNISLKGFMLPLKVEKGLVTEMLIMRDQSMCCYGTVPKINEWVSVRMEEQGVKPIMDEAVTIYGTLQVGEVLENGYLVGIYEMAGQKMDEPMAN